MALILVLCLVLFASIAVTFALLRLAVLKQWLDIPNSRSSHDTPRPKAGGLAFATVFTLAVALLHLIDLLSAAELWLYLLAIILTLTGLLDDIKELSIRSRLTIQVLVTVAALVLLPGLPPLPFHGFTLLSQPLLALLILPAFIWLINLYNFMDGIDALAAGEAIFVSLALAVFAGMSGSAHLALVMLVLASAVAGFLFFNLPPARIFMGDSGSNFLGYSLGISGLLAALSGAITLWTLLILLGVFIVDSSFTLVKRMLAGAVWYHGHRMHAYQQAARRLDSHSAVVSRIMLINICWLLPLAWLSVRYPQAGLWLVLLAWLPLVLLVHVNHTEGMGKEGIGQEEDEEEKGEGEGEEKGMSKQAEFAADKAWEKG